MKDQEGVNLHSTKENIKVRQNIDLTILTYNQKLTAEIDKRANLEATKTSISALKGTKDASMNFSVTVTVPVTTKVEKSPGTYNTVCLHCSHTCHTTCRIPNDSDKSRCIAMHLNHCTVCPNKCHWNVHHNLSYGYE